MNNPPKQTSVFWIEVEKIVPNPMQPRREFNPDALKDLSESIRQYGVLQPLVVTRNETDGPSGIRVEYELIAGERRLRASRLAGLSQVPVIIRDDTSEKLKLELAIIENLQREDLNPLDRALAFQKLIDSFDLKHQDVGDRVGKSRVFVTNSLRLLGLPEEAKVALVRGDISEGHCRPLLMLVGRPEAQATLLKDIIRTKMPVRDAERISRQIAVERARNKTIASIIPEITQMENKLSDILGTRVKIEKTGEKGKISIDFFSEEELNGFLNKVLGQKENIPEKENEDDKEVFPFDDQPDTLESDILESMFPEESEQPDDIEDLKSNFSL